MTNKKTTKRALVSSIMAIVLCFSMLLGTTFAWFTDTVANTGNKIVAGSLDVQLLMWNGTDYVDISDINQPIFGSGSIAQNQNSETLWEPGKTQVAYLAIKNDGNLDLKYQVALDVVNVAKDLYEVMQYAITPDVNAKNGKVNAWDNTVAKSVILGTQIVSDEDVALKVGETHYFALSIHMDENANNDYQNGEVSFDLRVLATQLASESDSFNNTYDENAEYDTYGTYVELNAGDDLLAAMASAEKDLPLTIKLNGNVEWPTEGQLGENDITPASSIVIDGNGYTITAKGEGVTPLGDAEAPMTLKNVKIVDESVSYAEDAWEFTYLEIGGPSLTCNNVTFVGEIQTGTNATFTNCSFNSDEESVYAVWVEDGSATFTNCTFTGCRGLKMHEDYGTEISSVVVKNCTFTDITKKPGIAIGTLNADTTVSVTGSTFINCQAGDQSKYIYESDTDVTTINFTEKDNTVLNNATVVTTKDELMALSAKALTFNNNVAEEAIIVIGADIDVDGAEFNAIIAQRGDKLTVVGNGHTISNVKIVSGANDNTTGQASMFYAYPNSTLTVSNLTLKDITVTAEENATGYAAAVVGYCEGTAILNNVDVVNATVTGVKSSGMLVGHLSGSLTATDCDLSGTVTLADFAEETNGHYAGKYIGTLAGAAELDNCTANITVSGKLNAANIGEVYGRKTAAGSSNVEFAKDGTQLDTAIANGATTVMLGSGQYIIPDSAKGKTLTIVGNGDTVVAAQDDGAAEGDCDYSFDGSTVTFENVTITTSTTDFPGYARMKGIYNNCTINGVWTLYDNSEFNNCTFNVSGDIYNVWTWGATEATFNGCTFNNDGKAVLLYGTVDTKLTMNDCTFNDKGGLTDLKAAIEIGNDYGRSYELIVNNATVNGYAINDKGIVTGTALWANKNSMGTDKLKVVVDGIDVY